jgi:hypothetical protein
MEGDLEFEDENLIFNVDDYRSTLSRPTLTAFSTHYDEEPSPQGDQQEKEGGRSLSSQSLRQSTLIRSSSPSTPPVSVSPARSPSTPSRGVPILAPVAAQARDMLFQSAPTQMPRNWAYGSLDDSTDAAGLYYSTESSAAAPQRRSSAQIIDTKANASSSSGGAFAGACAPLSTSFDSEFELNTEPVTHKGAFRDALSLRDEQLLLRLKQKQRELKQMEAALLKKQEEYDLLKVHEAPFM